MTDMDKITKAAEDYTKVVLAEYPDAADGGLAVGVNLVSDMSKIFTLSLTPAGTMPAQINPLQAGDRPHLPAPEELLLTHSAIPTDTQVSEADES